MITIPNHYSEDRIINAYTPINKIDNNIYLGSILAFNTPSIFKHLNIKHIICLRYVDSYLINNVLKEDNNINIHKFYMSHDQFLYMKNKFDYIFNQVTNILNKAIENNENVFIHCRSGQHRSVTILTGYLMKKYSIGWNNAFNIIQKQRLCADDMYILDDNFNVQLNPKASFCG